MMLTASCDGITARLRVLLLATCGCGAPALPAAPAPATVAADLATLRGFWLTRGYGSQYEITTDGVLLKSQITSISCIATSRAKLAGPRDGALAFRLEDGPVTFLVRPDGSPDLIRIHPSGTASDIVADRLPAKLAICQRPPPPDTPPAAFEVFAATWAENYPFFDLTKTDWSKVVAATRPKVTLATTPDELFEILKGMIAPLEDAHTFIQAPKLHGDGIAWAGFHKRPGALEEDQFPRAEALVNKYVALPLRRFCEGQIEAGMLEGDVGYLRFGSFADYAKDGTFESGLACLESTLDAAFADASRWRALVIDVRINGGGFDPYGLVVASRLTGSQYVAYAKQARSDPRDASKWTSEQPSVVRPSARPSFHGPVVELIGPTTVSAGETFTQALLERTPPVARVGQSTQGVFSDVMLRRLPNGWIIGIPNERFVTRGTSYDGAGIPPTLSVPLYAPADLDAGRDTVLEAALRLLRGAS